MKKDKSPLQNNVRKYLLPLLYILLGPVVSALLPDKTIHSIAQVLTQDQWLRVSAACFATLLVSFAYIGYLLWQQTRKPDFDDYIFDPIDQCWHHKSKQMWLCASCKVDNIFSPLAFTDEGDMICPKCDKPAKNFKLKHMKEMRTIFPSVKLENFTKDK